VKVVADSSALIILARIHHFGLLREIYSSITISEDVYREVVIRGAGLPGSKEVSEALWIQTSRLSHAADVASACQLLGLGAGEASTILLAQQLPADLVLIDDLQGRKRAREAGLNVQGSVALLESAFSKGYLPDLRQAFGDLLQDSYIGREILNVRLRVLNLPPL
jgi:predicted nucleic acid-binding protein